MNDGTTLRKGIAGADLSAEANMYKAVYLDSGDGYKVKLWTNTQVAAGTEAYGVLVQTGKDDKPVVVAVAGRVRMRCGAALNAGQLIAADSASRAIAATATKPVLGRVVQVLEGGTSYISSVDDLVDVDLFPGMGIVAP